MDIIQSFSDRNLGRYTLDNKYTRHLQDVSPIPLDGGYIVRNNIQDVPKTEELSEAELINMDTDRGKLWAAASKVIYDSMYDGVNALTIKEPESEQDYGRFGVEFMGQFDHNMSMMGYNVAKLQGVDERTKLAMHHMMTEFGQLPMFSWNGAYRVTKGMFTDPTTYASLGTLGLGFLGRAGVKQTTKQGFKEMLRRGITNPYAIAALEGGAYTGMYDYLTQEVNIEAGVQDDVNLGQLATATGTGMVAGPAIVGAGELAVKGAKKLMPGQGDLFDEPTPTSGAPLSAENLEASAVQKFAFYKNKEGGQEVGNKQIIVDIDENIFQNHVRPLLDKGMTYEEFEMGKMPGGLYENMHAAFTSVNGGDYKLTKVDDLNNLQPDQTYAIQVDDFNSPDAVTRRQTADSDVIPLGDNIAKFEPPTDDKPGIVAFHGSGADFDEFSLEKIGTGEGAQQYGYGLYFAQKEDIARFYKEAMEEPQPLELRGKRLDSVYTADNEEKFSDYVNDNFDPSEHDDVYTVLDNLGQRLMSVEDADRMAESSLVGAQKRIYQQIRKDLIEPEVGEGTMYKVGLQPKPEDMLDYQIPLEQQPEAVQDKAKQILKLVYPNVETPALTMAGFDLLRQLEMRIDQSIRNQMTQQRMVIDGKLEPKMTEATMDEIDKIVASKIADTSSANTQSAPKIASEIMLELGIPGIKYRDAGSRGGSTSLKDATFNFVVFDDKAIKILEKYGVAGPVAVTALASQQTQDDDARVANAPKI